MYPHVNIDVWSYNGLPYSKERIMTSNIYQLVFSQTCIDRYGGR